MKRATLTIAALLLAGAAQAAGGGPLPFHFEPDTANLSAVQRGARDYMAYCSGCHSIKHLRYNRLAADAGIPEDLLERYLMFTSNKVGDPILSAMPADKAAKWFGQAPPDLSLTVRQRTPSWVYSYLMSFHLDPSRPNGVNNLVLPGASMPHVLGELQGWQRAVYREETDPHSGESHKVFDRFELVVPGRLEPKAYEKRVADLTTFLAYASEPGKQRRIAIGKWVMVYLALFAVLAWLLKREYWRDVH